MEKATDHIRSPELIRGSSGFIIREHPMSQATQLADEVLRLKAESDELREHDHRNFLIAVCGFTLAAVHVVVALIMNWNF